MNVMSAGDLQKIKNRRIDDMNIISKIKISAQCGDCIHLEKKCKGKESCIPCMSKKTNHEYGLDKIKEIKNSLKGGRC